MMLPVVQNAWMANSVENFFEFGDVVPFNCEDGHTTSGHVGGASKFAMPCQSSGKFPHDHEACIRITCGKPPRVPDASASTGNEMRYGDSVTYACSSGHLVGGDEEKFSGQCAMDGRFKWGDAGASSPPRCQRRSCGELPNYLHAVPEEHKGPLRYKDVVTVRCEDGYVLDGIASGADSFAITCKDSGLFSKAPGICGVPMAGVSGEVTDVQNVELKIKGATVSIAKDGVGIVSVVTDNSGRFSVNVPMGYLNISVSQGGYISRTKPLVVLGRINIGQGADVAISKTLPPGEWRATLTWKREPEDLDSHVYFGEGFATHVYYPIESRSKTIAGTGGLKVTLDRDDIESYGPETTSFHNVGECHGSGKCLLKYRVNKFWGNGSLARGRPWVTVYRGDAIEASYDLAARMPNNVGRKLFTVFTLDAGRNAQIYEGAMKEGPHLEAKQGIANWWGSLDSQQWSRVPSGHLLTGLMRNSNGNVTVSHIEEGRFRRVLDTAGPLECVESDWWDSFNREGWSECPTGYYVSGLFRTGSTADFLHGIDQLQKAWCCKPKELPEKWGECASNHPTFNSDGKIECPDDTAMVGLHRTKDNTLNGIDRMKCCELERHLLPDKEEPLGKRED
jgi:hypothetical protein